MISTDYNELYHYGILGMKWGHHKPRMGVQTNKQIRMYKNQYTQAKNSYKNGQVDKKTYKSAKRNYKNAKKHRYDDDDYSVDKTVYGKGGAERVQKRINKGQTRNKARVKEFALEFSAGTAATIGMADLATGGLLHKAAIYKGKQAAVNFAKSYAAKKSASMIPRLTQNKYFDPIDVAYKILD